MRIHIRSDSLCALLLTWEECPSMKLKRCPANKMMVGKKKVLCGIVLRGLPHHSSFQVHGFDLSQTLEVFYYWFLRGLGDKSGILEHFLFCLFYGT